MRPGLIVTLLISSIYLQAQSAGGDAVYNFLRIPAGALNTALGGEQVSVISNENSTGLRNPALLRSGMHHQISANFTSIAPGIRNLVLTGGMHHDKLATNIGVGIQYFSYGDLVSTDAGGNETGSFRARDFVATVYGSRQYAGRWFYGAGIKYIGSNYGQYRSSAIAIDIGVNYYDSSRQLQFGLVMKNMGIQLRSYTGQGKDNLPFDLQLGFTKRLAEAPLQFSLTARELHRLILFKADSNGTFDQVFQHFIFATQFFIANKIELTAAYNHLRRQELRIANTSNGLTGFSMGIGVLLPRLAIRYARSNISNQQAWNVFGVAVNFASNSRPLP